MPARVVVFVYAVAGVLWILGSGSLADRFTELTEIPRLAVEVGKGVLFVTTTALVLHAVLRRRADRLDEAATGMLEKADRLVESEERNRLQAAALSGTANGVMITGRDGTIEWINAAFETMSGYPSSIAIGATPRLLESGVHDKDFFRELWETILAGRVWRGQVINRRSDGELYTVRQTITPVVSTDGEVQYFVAIHDDITEQVRAAQELEESRVRLESLFDHALDAIVLADDQGRYIAVNPAFSELTGYPRDELLGMRPADLAASDQQLDEVAAQFDDFVRTGSESGTFALQHAEGHVVETEYRAVSNIQPGVHLSIMRDVTARNRTLHALTVAEAEFRGLAETAADIVAKLRVDQDGRMQVDYINPAATAILGYPPEELYEEPSRLLDLLHLRRDELDDALDLLPTPTVPTRLATLQVQHRDGRLLWLEIQSTLVAPSTDPIAIQLVARDVTARFEMSLALEQALRDQLEAAEQLRTVNAMKDTFLQSVSHELRTPLTAILGFAQLLADPQHGLSPADTREFHGRILTNARRLKRLLEDLVDVDRFSRGHIEPNRLPTDLADLIERVVHDVNLGDRTIELDLEPLSMDLDAPLVERIVANLLHNIVRHTPSASHVGIQTRATSDGVEITVDDDGPGIPEADRQRVVEPFQQGAASASSATPGTGVGLALVTTFAQIHGGNLTITDSPTGGTRMTVTLAHAQTDGPGTTSGTG